MLDIPLNYITNIFYAFFAINDKTGDVVYGDKWADVELPMPSPSSKNKVLGNLNQLKELKRTHTKLKTSMSIGGWGTANAFVKVMKDPKKVDRFVESSVQLMLMHDFDGIDIDWEYPENEREALQLVDLLYKVRKRFDDLKLHGKLLTFASAADAEHISKLRIREMDTYLTFWNVMCYDFTGDLWSERSGFHSNLFGSNGDNGLNANDVIKSYIKSGIHPSKLVLGMPCYGKAFNHPQRPSIGQRFQKGPGKLPSVIDKYKLPIEGSKEEFDHRKVGAFCYDVSTKTLVVYDNLLSMRIKAKYVELNHLGGGMWWDSAGDGKEPQTSLIAAFVEQLGGTDLLR